MKPSLSPGTPFSPNPLRPRAFGGLGADGMKKGIPSSCGILARAIDLRPRGEVFDEAWRLSAAGGIIDVVSSSTDPGSALPVILRAITPIRFRPLSIREHYRDTQAGSFSREDWEHRVPEGARRECLGAISRWVDGGTLESGKMESILLCLAAWRNQGNNLLRPNPEEFEVIDTILVSLSEKYPETFQLLMGRDGGHRAGERWLNEEPEVEPPPKAIPLAVVVNPGLSETLLTAEGEKIGTGRYRVRLHLHQPVGEVCPRTFLLSLKEQQFSIEFSEPSTDLELFLDDEEMRSLEGWSSWIRAEACLS